MKKIEHKFLFIFAIFLLIASANLSNSQVLSQEISSESLSAQQKTEFLDAVIDLIKTRFYDKNYSELNLAELREEFLPEVLLAQNSNELHKVVNKMIALFKVSHFAIIEQEIFQGIANERTNTLTPEFGFKLQKIDNQFFATRFSQGGAAEKANLQNGDEILEVNNVKIADSDKLLDAGNDVGIPGPEYYVLKASKNEKITLKIKRKPDEAPFVIELTAQDYNETKAIENSVSVIEKAGKKFGYIHTWHFLTSKVAEIFYDAIRNKFKNCDAMILDIRGHGGNALVIQMMLAPFTEQRFRRAPKWTKPLVVLIDEGTRSAKEIFAHVIKRDKLGVLIGRKTQGAVLATQFFELPDKSALMIPVMDARNLVQGNPKLEGVGVTPDVEVEFNLKYANGTDEILEAGIKKALLLTLSANQESPAKPDAEDEIIEDF